MTKDTRLRRNIDFAARVAPTSHPILLLGETGTGKDLFAEELHRESGVRGPFVAENVAGLDEQLFADALFGHTKGAFTGASTDRRGLIAQAAGGTLFLDEIGDLSIASQIKLLRVIENRTYFQLGNDSLQQVDTRFVFATSSNLLRRIETGLFRPDLYFRLSAYEIHLPPLRERGDDIKLLVSKFVKEAAESIAIDIPLVKPSFVQVLRRHRFPGNVRELRTVILKAVTLCHGSDLDGDIAREVLDNHLVIDIDWDFHRADQDNEHEEIVFPSKLPTMLEARKALVAEALRRTSGNQSQAARLLDLTPAAVNKFVSKYRLK